MHLEKPDAPIDQGYRNPYNKTSASGMGISRDWLPGEISMIDAEPIGEPPSNFNTPQGLRGTKRRKPDDWYYSKRRKQDIENNNNNNWNPNEDDADDEYDDDDL